MSNQDRSNLRNFGKGEVIGQTLGIGGLTGGFINMARNRPQPEVPGLTPVTPMPVPGQDDLSNIAAQRRSLADQLRRRGRLSTILSQPQSEPLGG